MLEDEGYTVQAVGDGRAALAAIQSDSPALALLDAAMPVMTGDGTLRQLCAEGPFIPVIIMTAGMSPQRFLQSGAARGGRTQVEATVSTIEFSGH